MCEHDSLAAVEREISRRKWELAIDRRLRLDGVPALIVSGPWGQAVVRNLAELERHFGKRAAVVPSGRSKQKGLFDRTKQLELFS